VSGKRYDILIVDDSAEDREFYRRRLPEGQSTRYQFKEAESCAEGLALCREWSPDCVILDYALPDADGLEFLAQLRASQGGEAIAVVILTGQGNETVAVEALKLGAQDYVVKSGAIEMLRQAVHGAIEKVGLQSKIEEQRRELARSEEILQDFVTNATLGLTWLSEDGTVLWANRAQLSLLGYAHAEFVGRNLAEFHADPGAAARMLERLSRSEELDGYEARMRAKDGGLRHVLINANVLWENGKFVHARCFTRDITERRALEEELRKRYEDLREADRRKDEFLAMLAHELRNPLAPVRSATDLLRMRGDDRQTVEFVTNVLDRQVGHLARLVDDLLDVARITRGSIGLRRARLDLARLVGDVVEDHRRAIGEAGLSPQVQLPEAPVWMNGDATRIAQMLGNLLSNAVKFTARGGVVTVCLSVDPAQSNASLVVQDTGVGMDQEMLPRIFDVFSQADRTLERKDGGLGLGLSIVKGLIQLHGGTIEAQSEGIGKGARFSISLPLCGEPPALTKAPALSRLPSRIGARVLIVEDNADAARTLKMLLELQGYAVSVAFNAQDGLRLASEWQPEAVLCDIGLPGMDGFAVAKELRRNPITGQVRLIAITGYGRDEDRARALQCGFDEHIVKPADPELLLEKLDGFKGL
jgi:PAS domain S-box-containing protein